MSKALVSDACAAPASSSLTRRQREIFRLLCEGSSNKEIALQLRLAEVTVKMHVTSIYRALGVAKRVQAVAAAYRFGWIER